MRRCRINLPNRCYHLVSRVAHRAYFLDGDERTRLVDFVRRVAEFSGVKLLAYCVMSNHFHVFVYIGRPEPLSDAEIVRRISAQMLKEREWKDSEDVELARANRRPDQASCAEIGARRACRNYPSIASPIVDFFARVFGVLRTYTIG